ncbi:hypothetical protein DWV00_01290 [Trinickia dinghuensis]|uniref:Uncharacterized protein n=1 Tax=Trinickia dinghuensis TaxID=2291023 RepID=A0A3D8K4U3_9BURK|nr:hypothetical protein DWV00_01290 [Trinickia dinghuensis]
MSMGARAEVPRAGDAVGEARRGGLPEALPLDDDLRERPMLPSAAPSDPKSERCRVFDDP